MKLFNLINLPGVSVFYLVFLTLKIESKSPLDLNGYTAYCPCMGRFGNQADHFLGALGFAKGLNRTLVLPPWVEYRFGEPKSIQVPFDTYFKVEALSMIHRVITMEKFMTDIAPHIWPPEKRVSFCYMERGKSGGCNAKEGNPFGPFWDTFNINFIDSEIYGPLHYDVHHTNVANKWKSKYPADKWPVLAFAGAPGSFPVQKENKDLHRFLKWSDKINDEADLFIKERLPKGAFIGIHLRNGMDWVRACEHISPGSLLFSAAQCLGYMSEKGQATQEMCFPSTQTIIKQLKRVIRRAPDPVVAIAVASDSNHLIPDLKDAFKWTQITIHKIEGSTPHVDLAILGRAQHFIGNCISSFTAFVKRERDARGFLSEFWAFPPLQKSNVHDEF